MIIRTIKVKAPPPLILILLVSSLIEINSQYLANNFFTSTDVNPGFYSTISQSGFDLMASFLTDRTNKVMKFGDFNFNVTAPLNSIETLQLSSISIDFYDHVAFSSKLISEESQLKWSGRNFKVTIKSEYKIFSNGGEISGIVPLLLEGTSFNLYLKTGVNGDGHLKTELTKCNVVPDKITLAFTSSESDVLKNTIAEIYKVVRQNINDVICPTLVDEIVPVISNRLFNTPLSVALFDHYFLNYGLLGNVTYAKGKVELAHRGNAFGILRQGRTRLNDFRLPFKANELVAVENEKMVTFTISNYTLSSLLFWMDQYRKLDFEINSSAINNTMIAGYLKTDCGVEDICAGTLFPSLAEKFPNGVVMIKTHTVSFPVVKISKGKVNITMESKVDAFVQQPDKKRRFLTANMFAEISLQKPSFKDYSFNGQLKIEKTKISNVVSLVDGINADSLEFLVNALNELFIADEMMKKLKDGIKLPIILDFEQKKSEVTFLEDKMMISADYCFDEGCKASVGAGHLQASTDTDASYYDVVQSS
uniref:BPI2 domain-containing protein n=1 Tax=Rhabditophanes sp. KR3021 TaxID=114890 RepID=A0AC35UD12_9BILA